LILSINGKPPGRFDQTAAAIQRAPQQLEGWADVPADLGDGLYQRRSIYEAG